MPIRQWAVPLFLVGTLALPATQASGQQPQDSSTAHVDSAKAARATPAWRDSVRYGGGPSVGAPPSDYSGAKPPADWCLRATRRAPGDFGVTGQNWTQASRSWLRRVLSDTTRLGAGWRKVLGGAPELAPSDSIVQVTDKGECRVIAEILNRELLGWKVGPPPVVVFRVKDYLIAYPSNARMGEFGMAAGMTLGHQIRGVATW
jgi:hypothetical protein